MNNKELLELIEQERSSYFQYITRVHCDEERELNDAWHVLETFTERLKTAIEEI